MKHPESTADDRVRRAWRVFMFSGVVSLGILCLYLTRPSETGATSEESAAVEPVSPPEPAANAEPVAAASPGPLEAKWGIQIIGLELSKEGGTVELRYRVVTPEKTALLADGGTAAWLVEATSGAKIPLNTPPPEGLVRTHSRARSMALMMPHAGGFPPAPSRLIAGSAYSILLSNPGGALQKGSKASLVIGDSQADNLIVE